MKLESGRADMRIATSTDSDRMSTAWSERRNRISTLGCNAWNSDTSGARIRRPKPSGAATLNWPVGTPEAMAMLDSARSTASSTFRACS